jgi:hypothetical protein
MDFHGFRMPEPGTAGVNAGLGFLDNVLVRAARADRERQQQMIENLRYAGQEKRQRQQDFQAALKLAKEYEAAGDIESARAVLKPFEDQPGAASPPVPGAQTRNQALGYGGDEIPYLDPAGQPQQRPNNYDPGKAAAERDAWRSAQPQLEPSQPPAFQPPMTEDDELAAHHAGIAPAGPAADPTPARQQLNPLVAAARGSAGKAEAQAAVVRGSYMGVPITLDPNRHTAEVAARRKELAEQMQNAGLDPQHVQFGMTMLNMGVDPGKVGQLVAGMTEKALGRASVEGMQEKRLGAATDLESQKHGNRLELEDKQIGAGKYKRRTGAGDGTGAGGYNPKVERANKAALSSLDTSTARWAKTSGFEHMAKAYEEAERALVSLEANNPAGAAHALEKFVSVSRGGMATNAALALFQKHLSGWGGRVEGAVEEAKSGNLGPEKTENLRSALETVKQSLKDQIEAKRQSFVNSYFTPAYGEMKGNVEDTYERLFGPLGYQTEYDPNARTIALGTGQRAAASGRTPNHLESASKQGQLSPEDQARARMARERLAKDPNDAVAKQWLEHHGL